RPAKLRIPAAPPFVRSGIGSRLPLTVSDRARNDEVHCSQQYPNQHERNNEDNFPPYPGGLGRMVLKFEIAAEQVDDRDADDRGDQLHLQVRELHTADPGWARVIVRGLNS